jgi:hypothetical protein
MSYHVVKKMKKICHPRPLWYRKFGITSGGDRMFLQELQQSINKHTKSKYHPKQQDPTLKFTSDGLGKITHSTWAH